MKFAGSEGTPYHVDLASKVEVLGTSLTLRLALDVAGNGDMAGEAAAKSGTSPRPSSSSSWMDASTRACPGEPWARVMGDPTTSDPLGELPLDKVDWMGLDRSGAQLHHLRIDDPSIVSASNAEDAAITDLDI